MMDRHDDARKNGLEKQPEIDKGLEHDKGLEITRVRGPELTPERLHEMGYYTRFSDAAIRTADSIR